MNGVCTNIIHLDQKTLKYYGGNYDTFVKTKEELEENQEKRYQWEQDQIAHMKVVSYFEVNNSFLLKLSFNTEKVEIAKLFIIFVQNYIARFGHGSAKLARQAQSKEKTLAKMVAGGLTEKVKTDKSVSFYFFR